MVDYIQFFLLGASFMFSALIAWIFRRKSPDMLARLVSALMIVIAIGFVKDAIVMADLSNLTELMVEFSTGVDTIAVPLYAAILVELCNPGKLTVKSVCLWELPFIALPVLLLLFRQPVFYYIDMILAVLAGLYTAIWACFAIPRYHKYLKANFSYDDNINLKWLQSILWAFFVLLISWALSCVDRNAWVDVVYMVSSLTLWIFICYFIYRHKSVVEELRPALKTESIPSPTMRHEVFARIRKLIEEDKIYLNPLLKLSDIARLANTNRSYASAYFSSEVGTTFYDHINQMRVNHSLGLLADPSKRLDEVAEQSGFNSRQSFHRVFLSIKGLTPNSYRTSLQTAE